MKLRFGLYAPTYQSSPEPHFCGQDFALLSETDMELELIVDGTSIISTSDLSSVVMPLQVVTTENGYTVTVTRINNLFRVTIPLDFVWQSTTVYIRAVCPNHFEFENTFTVYGFDLGNNPLEEYTNGFSMTKNPDFKIFLVPYSDGGTEYGEGAYAKFITYRKPFSDVIHLYNAVGNETTLADYYQYIDGEDPVLLSEDLLNVNIQDSNTINIYQSVVGEDGTCTSDIVESKKLIFVPDFSVIAEQPNVLDCVAIENEINIIPNIDYSVLDKIYVNDTQSYGYVAQTLQYLIYNNAGNLVHSFESYSFDVDNVPFIFDPTLYTKTGYSFTEVGDYFLKIIVGSPNLYSCSKNVLVPAVHWYEVKRTDCNTYTISNHSLVDFTVTINKMIENNVFIEDQVVTVPSLETITIIHETDNIYTYQITKDDETYLYVVINVCSLLTGLKTLANDLLCCNPKDLCQRPDVVNFNSFAINLYTLFAMLHEEYNINFIYTALDGEKLLQLYEINDVILNGLKYLNDIDSINCNAECN